MMDINREILFTYLSKAYYDIEFILNNKKYNTPEEFVLDFVSGNNSINIEDKNIKITTLHMFIVAMLCHIENDTLVLRKLYYYQLYVLVDAFYQSKSIDQICLNKIVDEMIDTEGEQ